MKNTDRTKAHVIGKIHDTRFYCCFESPPIIVQQIQPAAVCSTASLKCGCSVNK